MKRYAESLRMINALKRDENRIKKLMSIIYDDADRKSKKVILIMFLSAAIMEDITLREAIEKYHVKEKNLSSRPERIGISDERYAEMVTELINDIQLF